MITICDAHCGRAIVRLLKGVGASLGRNTNVCHGYLFLDEISGFVKGLGLPLPQLLGAGGSYFNDADYPLHLAAVQVFLLKELGDVGGIIDDSAENFVKREPLNPFFSYLAGYKSGRDDMALIAQYRSSARKLTLEECPTSRPSQGEPQEWAWERQGIDKRWLRSIYWDCIFMANLLRG
jgi:hypothetical protein